MEAGEHKDVTNNGRDVNGRDMMHCRNCQSTINTYGEEPGLKALARFKCVPNCKNCASLRNSYDRAPAVPIGGTCNTIHHTCPICGARWWQFNTHFHLWGQVE